MYRECRVVYLGNCEYQEAYAMQKQLVCRRMGGRIPDILLLLSHPPVLTIGRRAAGGHILVTPDILQREGIIVYETDRSGDIAYHGPGQLVAYPILHMDQHWRDLHRLIHMYEEVIIRVLAEYGIKGIRQREYPGVWVEDERIATVGIGVNNWVSYHGFTLNINTNLRHFSFIASCDNNDEGATSLEKILGAEVDEEEVRVRLVNHFGDLFKMNMINKPSSLDIIKTFPGGDVSGG